MFFFLYLLLLYYFTLLFFYANIDIICVTNRMVVKEIMNITVNDDTIFWNLLFIIFPIIFRSLINRIMNISITGTSTPAICCVLKMSGIKFKLGIKTRLAVIPIIPNRIVKKAFASEGVLLTPFSQPNASQMA